MRYHSIPKSVPRSSSVPPQTESSQMQAQIETMKSQIQNLETEIVILRRKRQKMAKKVEYLRKIVKVQKRLQAEKQFLTKIEMENEELKMKIREQNQETEELKKNFEVLQVVVGWMQVQEKEAEIEEWKKKCTDMMEFARELVCHFEKADAAMRADSSLQLPTEISEFMECCASFATALRLCLEC